MTVVDEGYLRFEFDAEWNHVEQWDKTTAYADGVGIVEDVKALDIIALSKNRKECLLIEVKDFRDQNDAEDVETRRKSGRKTRAKPALVSQEQTASVLAEQVAKKVAGTLAGLVGAARMQDTKFAGDFSTDLAAHRSSKIKVRVVLWVEGRPTSKGRSPREKANLGTLTQSLKKKVAWLTRAPVQVLSTAVIDDGVPIPGVKVTDNRP